MLRVIREAVMKNKFGKVYVSAVTLAVVFSLVFSVSGMSASAAKTVKSKNKLPAATEKINAFAKCYKYVARGKTSYGYDWTYKVNTKNVKVTCKYDFKTKNYTFRIKGKKYGLTKVTLKYKKNTNTWVSVPMKVFVDPKNNIMRTKIKQV
jgi:hypothetical protein